MNDVMFVS